LKLITLTTDFGLRDSYVAQLKAALYQRGPSDLQVVDLSHELPAQDVRHAALFIADALARFPPETVHLVVVDPGVGSARLPLALRSRDQVCVGPDNGVFSLFWSGELEAVAIEPERIGASQLSATFHGRDVFAPAAALLAAGRTLESVGRLVDPGTLVRLSIPAPQRDASGFTGEVIHVDHYGNVITNLRSAELAALARDHAGAPALKVRNEVARIANHYAEVPEGSVLGLLGSSDRLEIAVRNGSAAERIGIQIGERVRLQAV
jgi:S-adenosylmethionine hydrolase